MSAIRPGLPLNTPAQGLDLPSARSAQAAFFRAALNQTVTSVGLAAVGGAAGRYGDAVNAYGGLAAQYGLLLPYSRRDELEADRLGVDYMAGAGFKPSQAVALWRLMAAQRQTQTPQFASTHPSDATRIEALQQYIASRGWN